MDGYYLQALILVVAMPVIGVATLVGAGLWVRDAIARSPVVGTIGVALTAVAIANLVVPRRLDGVVNRPIISLALDTGAAERAGAIGLQLVLLGVIGTALAVRADWVRQALTRAR